MVFGRYRGEGKPTLKLAGTVNGKPQELPYSVEFGTKETNEFLPRVWATRKVAYLLSEIRLRGANKELVDEVTALGKQYGIITPYTSFLVVEEDMAAPLRKEIAAARDVFEKGDAGGRNAVERSRGLGFAKKAEAPAAAPATAGFGGDDSAKHIDRLVQQKIHYVSDKTFYLRQDGFLYDSLFREEDRGKIVDLEFLGEKYFEAVRERPGLARYLAAGKSLVVCFEGTIYRVKAQ
jgi:Ca-activated chloride channel family protein